MVFAVIGNIIAIGVLTLCALFHFVYDLKAIQMNVQLSLNWKLMLYEFKLGYNTTEATKIICCGEGEVDQ